MPYFVREFEPSGQIRGPFKTLGEARKKAMNTKFADGGNIYRGDNNLCVYEPKALVGQVCQGYNGRWFKAYVDMATRKEYYLNKDGTLGRRL